MYFTMIINLGSDLKIASLSKKRVAIPSLLLREKMIISSEEDITDTHAHKYLIGTTHVRNRRMRVAATSVVPRKEKWIRWLLTLNHSGCHFEAKYKKAVVKL